MSGRNERLRSRAHNCDWENGEGYTEREGFRIRARLHLRQRRQRANGAVQKYPMVVLKRYRFPSPLPSPHPHTKHLPGFDSSAPVGPVLVSPSSLPNPHSLRIKAIHNGSVVQDSNTSEMIFGIEETIAFLSQGTTLERGSMIMTGTPPGIGAMREPKVVLNHGDDIRVEIEGIGMSSCKNFLCVLQVRERPVVNEFLSGTLVNGIYYE